MLSRARKAQIVPCFGSIEFVTCLWIACAVLTLVASQQNFYIHSRYGKRDEPPRADYFYISGRYGRNDVMQKPMKSVSKLVQVVPRVDRFFSGSRYGKRSSPDYPSAVSSSVNRFNAVLDYIDRVNRDDDEIHNDAKTNEDDLQFLS